MIGTLLTKGGGLLGPIASILGLIMNGIYEFFHLFGIQNIALSVIVFTFITKTLMLPLTMKQQKFTKLSSKMNPELQKIQAKYKGKKDEVSLKKQQAETQAVYQKYGASPTAGCLPLLISLPIMFALYQVINNIPAYVGSVKDLYEAVAKPIFENSQYLESFKSETVLEGIRVSTENLTTVDQVINILSKFKPTNWENLAGSIPALQETITAQAGAIKQVNNFFGLNIADSPGFSISFKLLIPIIAAGLQFFQGKQMQMKNKDGNKDNPAASAMGSMNIVMPIMSLFFCITLPIGIGLYWIATSVVTIIQQYFINKYLDRVDVDEMIQKNVEKQTKRKTTMQAKGMSINELARKQTKSIESTVTDKTINDEVGQDESEDNDTDTPSSNGPKSISEIANLLKNRNDKGDK